MWKKACDSGGCVEVDAEAAGQVLVRDSKDPEVVLTFTRKEWDEFIAAVKAGTFG
jgi:hypothetical protein